MKLMHRQDYLDVEEDIITSQISDLFVNGISPTSIKVSWKLDVGKVDGFYILYRPKIGEPPGFTSITVLHAAATRYCNRNTFWHKYSYNIRIFSYVVNRLTPHTPYEFLVIPFRRGLSGESSALIEAWTLEARPAEPPTELRWYQVNTSSVDIVWKPLEK